VKRFYCNCGGEIFFENHQCLNCQTAVGFDPERMQMVTLDHAEHLAYCANEPQFGACNWVRSQSSDNPLCTACQFNRTIPNLGLDDNLKYWTLLEQAKKRLFFTLMQLGLPLHSGWEKPGSGLLFDFLDDARSKPEHFEDSFVTSGFSHGVVTLNLLEADDIARAAMQAEMREPYRTLLGHFRHESGHYYWSLLVANAQRLSDFKCLFGDPDADYANALETYYQNGPAPRWSETHISAYATAHPLEDWAETWGHYLHIFDALETAQAHNLIPSMTEDVTIADRVSAWQQVSVMLNELNRSVGRTDAYPFSIGPLVVEKLQLVDRVIEDLRDLQ
jgi:hypothetical protein